MATQMGTVVGTPENCTSLLEQEECVMAFPEGARGANKPFRRRYRLERFGQGFLRLALQTSAPIVPVGIVGSEEQQPGLANLEGLGRALGLPSLPITISTPWLGRLGPSFALPVKYHLHFGEPLRFTGHGDEEDEVVERHVLRVRGAIAELLRGGPARPPRNLLLSARRGPRAGGRRPPGNAPPRAQGRPPAGR